MTPAGTSRSLSSRINGMATHTTTAAPLVTYVQSPILCISHTMSTALVCTISEYEKREAH